MRKKKLLGICIPVVCVGLCAALMLPTEVRSGMMPENGGNSGEPESVNTHKDHSGSENDGRFSFCGVSVSRSGSGVTHTYTDPAILNRVQMAVNAAVFAESAVDRLPDSSEGEDNATKWQATEGMYTGGLNGAAEYVLYLTCENGTVSQYLLRGQILTDRQTGVKYTVPEEELQLLMSVLEIAG